MTDYLMLFDIDVISLNPIINDVTNGCLFVFNIKVRRLK